jgi:hypothetical protein
LNGFALPRAIINFEQHSFVAWNPKFLEQTGLSERGNQSGPPVSSSIVAALFLIETAKIELEHAGLPQAETVAKASDILTETTEKITDVLSPGEDTRSES